MLRLYLHPINKIIGSDVRGLKYLHWCTFLSAFVKIGECTFSTFVAIRDKLNRGVKLDKSEERIYKENRDRIKELQKNIYDMMYIPQYITVVMESTKDYERIFKKGFIFNNKTYRRISCSAS